MNTNDFFDAMQLKITNLETKSEEMLSRQQEAGERMAKYESGRLTIDGSSGARV